MFDPEGRVSAVTLLEAGPVRVTQIKTKAKDGYDAVQVGFGTKKKKLSRWLREFRVGEEEAKGFKVGDKIDVAIFEKGDKVKLTGTSKGRGFAGVVKRHGFHGAPKTHGTKHALREPGSIGATHPQHVIKGRRMAGHMGAERVTLRKIKIVEVDPEKNLLAVEGGVPGAPGSLVEIRG